MTQMQAGASSKSWLDGMAHEWHTVQRLIEQGTQAQEAAPLGGNSALLSDLCVCCDLSAEEQQLDVNALRIARMQLLLHGASVSSNYHPGVTHMLHLGTQASESLRHLVWITPEAIPELIAERRALPMDI
eukprot:TRINITY_DN15313_c0_g1_i1.p1 TRINITY_DN15313_c0_g1~~TRINITY_DN15313_c0_g1_i1.p1  ORF type:complete len:130 (+),score=41.95 TRINITY_DN15313_c0_g1_i1:177-566(+)